MHPLGVIRWVQATRWVQIPAGCRQPAGCSGTLASLASASRAGGREGPPPAGHAGEGITNIFIFLQRHTKTCFP